MCGCTYENTSTHTTHACHINTSICQYCWCISAEVLYSHFHSVIVIGVVCIFVQSSTMTVACGFVFTRLDPFQTLKLFMRILRAVFGFFFSHLSGCMHMTSACRLVIAKVGNQCAEASDFFFSVSFEVIFLSGFLCFRFLLNVRYADLHTW